mgnify:CR=1 FL=1|jgi:ribosome-binding factor A
MARRRIERLNEQLKREITEILRLEVKDPRVGWATLTGVETSPDLSIARVYVSLMGEEEEKAQTLAGLRAAAPFIRTELGRRLYLRRAPELRFEVDRTLERAMRIERLLHEASAGRAEEGAESPLEEEAGGDGDDGR